MLIFKPGLIAQFVPRWIADPGVMSLSLAWPHNFMETDHEILSTVIPFFSLIEEGLLSVISKCMCTEYWLTA